MVHQSAMRFNQGLWCIPRSEWLQAETRRTGKLSSHPRPPLRASINIKSPSVCDFSIQHFWMKHKEAVSHSADKHQINLVTVVAGSLSRDRIGDKSCVLYCHPASFADGSHYLVALLRDIPGDIIAPKDKVADVYTPPTISIRSEAGEATFQFNRKQLLSSLESLHFKTYILYRVSLICSLLYQQHAHLQFSYISPASRKVVLHILLCSSELLLNSYTAPHFTAIQPFYNGTHSSHNLNIELPLSPSDFTMVGILGPSVAYSRETSGNIRRIMRSYVVGADVQGSLLNQYDLLMERLNEHVFGWRKILVGRNIHVHGVPRTPARIHARHGLIERAQHVKRHLIQTGTPIAQAVAPGIILPPSEVDPHTCPLQIQMQSSASTSSCIISPLVHGSPSATPSTTSFSTPRRSPTRSSSAQGSALTSSSPPWICPSPLLNERHACSNSLDLSSSAQSAQSITSPKQIETTVTRLLFGLKPGSYQSFTLRSISLKDLTARLLHARQRGRLTNLSPLWTISPIPQPSDIPPEYSVYSVSFQNECVDRMRMILIPEEDQDTERKHCVYGCKAGGKHLWLSNAM